MDKKDRLIDWEEREKLDENADGIDDEIEPDIPDVSAGSREMRERLRNNPNSDPGLSGGDVDAHWEMAESQGDEAVGGSMPTPGQSNVQEQAAAVGISYQDDEELKAGEKERSRDKNRWELDPASSDDYAERAREQSSTENRKDNR